MATARKRKKLNEVKVAAELAKARRPLAAPMLAHIRRQHHPSAHTEQLRAMYAEQEAKP